MKIATVLVTIDRSPRKNYLLSSVRSLKESGFFANSAFTFTIFHTGASRDNLDHALLSELPIKIHCEEESLHFNSALPLAMRQVAASQPDFILFMEDDIEVNENFPEFVIETLAEYGANPLMDFATYYQEVVDAYLQGERRIKMDAEKFWGTQCFAMTCDNALSFADFVEQHHASRTLQGYADVWFGKWLDFNQRVEQTSHSVPSPVQHAGVESTYDHDYLSGQAYINDLELMIPCMSNKYIMVDEGDEKFHLRHVDNATQIQLNDSAQLIYLHCDGSFKLGQIIDDIHQATGVERRRLSSEIRGALASLKAKGLIDVVNG